MHAEIGPGAVGADRVISQKITLNTRIIPLSTSSGMVLSLEGSSNSVKQQSSAPHAFNTHEFSLHILITLR